MRARGIAASLGVAIAVVMVLSSLATVTTATAAAGTPVAASSASSSSSFAAQAQLEKDGAGLEQVANYLRSDSPAEIAADVGVLKNLTTAQLQTFLDEFDPGAGLTPAEIEEAALEPTIDWEGIGKAALVGCGAGAAIGLAAAGLGAGAGCVIGALATGFAFYWGESSAKTAQASGELQWASAMTAELGNEFAIEDADYQTEYSLLNETYGALEAEAENAALSQLGNSTFNVALDLDQSGVVAQLETLEGANDYIVSDALQLFLQWYGQSYCNGGQFAADSGYNYAMFGATVLGRTESGSPACAWGGAIVYSGDLEAGQSALAYVAQNATIVSPEISSGQTCILTSTARSSGNETLVTFTSERRVYNWTLPSQIVYVEATDDAACNFASVDGMLLFATAPSTTAPAHGLYDAYGCTSGPGCSTLDALASGTGLLTGLGGLSNVGASYDLYVCKYQATCDASENTIVGPYTLATNIWGEGAGALLGYGRLIGLATSSAEAYWAFLRQLGYTSTLSIPADCIIPYPSQVLPPAWSNAESGMTESELFSLYTAWLNGLARFFDAQANYTACQGHPPFPGLGGLPWSSLTINVTGYGFLANGTQYPHQQFAKDPTQTDLSSWALNGSLALNGTVCALNSSDCSNVTAKDPLQLLIWPTVASVTLTVGKVFEVPSNDPLMVYPTQVGTLFEFYGNGTAVSDGTSTSAVSTDASSSPGDALYVTSCTVNGSAESSCEISLSTINGTLANLTCPNGAKIADNCAFPSTSIYGGFPNILSALESTFCYLFTLGSSTSCSGLTGIAAEVAGVLVILLVIGGLAYAVYYVATRRSRKGGEGSITIRAGKD